MLYSQSPLIVRISPSLTGAFHHNLGQCLQLNSVCCLFVLFSILLNGVTLNVKQRRCSWYFSSSWPIPSNTVNTNGVKVLCPAFMILSLLALFFSLSCFSRIFSNDIWACVAAPGFVTLTSMNAFWPLLKPLALTSSLTESVFMDPLSRCSFVRGWRDGWRDVVNMSHENKTSTFTVHCMCNIKSLTTGTFTGKSFDVIIKTECQCISKLIFW